MPQMMPIKWTTMLIVFSLIFMLFNAMNYFSYIPKNKTTTSGKMNQLKKLNWKW
uniref:ATP synthase F0 subunit 8 n=1 Tax=Hodotermes mossambicus TaxID=187541 RepID=UPI002551CBB1|nr:ATP synthase F0 subunit 8 [Hodotermes mossambicus]UYX57320.1 ATP synthase F0 subunit 8 [Hodotermes mossambicus]